MKLNFEYKNYHKKYCYINENSRFFKPSYILPITRYLIYFSLTGKSIWQLVLEQFDDLLVKILLLAAIISFVSITRDRILY